MERRGKARSLSFPMRDTAIPTIYILTFSPRFDEEPDFMKNLGFITETALHDLFASSNETPPTL